MMHTVGRLSWLAAAVLAGCVMSAGVSRAEDDEGARAHAAYEKGWALKENGQLKEAVPYMEKALELATRAYGKDHPNVAVILNDLAIVYQAMSQYTKAEMTYQRALKIREDKLGKNDPDVANTLNNLGTLYQDMGQNAKAEPLLLRSLQIREDKLGKNDPDVANSLNNLGTLYQDMGQNAKAEPLLLRGLQIREDKLGKNHPDVANSLNNVANLYEEMGQYAKAEHFYQRSLQIREDKLGKNHPDVANSLTNLAGLYRAMGQYAKAESLALRGLRIREDMLGKDHPEVANSLTNLASLYNEMGQYAKAESLYQRGLQIREDKLGKDHPDVARSLNDLALLYLDLDQYAKAEPLLQRCLQIKEDAFGKDHPSVAASLNNLALLYHGMGQYAKAEPLYRRSLKIAEDKLGKDHPYVGQALNNLGGLYNDMGQYAKAEPFYLRGLQIREDKLGKNHPDVASSLINLAILYAAQSRWKEAVETADRERRIVRRHAAGVLPILSEKDQFAFLNHTDVRAFHAAESLALGRRGDTAAAALSAGWVLNGKAVAHEALAQRALLALDAKDPAAAELSQQLLAVRRRLAALTQAPAPPGQEDQRRRERDDLAAQEKDLAERLGKAGGHTQRAEPWVELAEVRKALPANAVLIEISKFQVFNFEAKGQDKQWLGSRYAAWAIPSEGQGEVRVIDLGDADAIEDAVKAVRRILKDAQGSPKHPSTITQDGEPDAEKALLKPMRELSRLVLEPLAEQIDGKKRWYISPDASLWLVPWAALPLKDGRYAVEAHTISYLVSGRDLAAAPSRAKPGRPRILADPDYDLSMAEARAATADLVGNLGVSGLALRGLLSGLPLGKALRLPGTAAEAKTVKPALEKYAGEEAWLYQRDKALEGVFKTFRGPRVLVLSTHGFFLEDQVVASSDKVGSEEKRPALDKDGKPLENPLLRCGLLLAGCNNRDQAKEGDEDGVLTGLEVVGTDLRGTELVVLSACETGLGDVHNGEGVAGLRQAFQLAGARAVAATLWQIPDRESAKLMGDFFGNLADAKDKAEALRQAQLAMIKQRRDKNAAAHPFFWAAFTLTGQ
jgi:CHAT domain-containing protein/tetratricopeptide (TPR) repeat protein